MNQTEEIAQAVCDEIDRRAHQREQAALDAKLKAQDDKMKRIRLQQTDRSYPDLDVDELLTLEAGLYNRKDTAFHATPPGYRIQRKLNQEWERILGPEWRRIKSNWR